MVHSIDFSMQQQRQFNECLPLRAINVEKIARKKCQNSGFEKFRERKTKKHFDREREKFLYFYEFLDLKSSPKLYSETARCTIKKIYCYYFQYKRRR